MMRKKKNPVGVVRATTSVIVLLVFAGVQAIAQQMLLPILAKSQRNPVFSTDGKRILFTADTLGITQIFAYTLATKQLTQLTHDSLGFGRFCVHPSKAMLLAARGRRGGRGLYWVSLADGSIHKALQTTGDVDMPALNRRTTVAYYTRIQDAKFSIVAQPIGGGVAQILLNDSLRTLYPSVHLRSNEIAFFGRSAAQTAATDELFVCSSKKGLVQLTHNTWHDFAPCWVGRSKCLVYATIDSTWHSDANQIALLDIETKKQVFVTHAYANHTEPVASPDGRWLVYARRELVPGSPYRLVLQSLCKNK